MAVILNVKFENIFDVSSWYSSTSKKTGSNKDNIIDDDLSESYRSSTLYEFEMMNLNPKAV